MRRRRRSPSTRRIFARRVLLSLLVAFAAAVWSMYEVSLAPPDLSKRQLEIGGAATHFLVDAERSMIVDKRAYYAEFTALAWRAELFAQMVDGSAVIDDISRRTGIPAGEIAVIPRLTAGVPDGLRDPDSEQRADQILHSERPYRLDLQPDPLRPVVHVYAQAPTPAAAVQLADATVPALRDELASRPAERVPEGKRLVIEQLGHARGQVINGRTGEQMVLLTFLVAFLGCLGLLSAGAAIGRGWAAGRLRPQSPFRAPSSDRGSWRDWGSADDDNWPHTSRVLPWAVAGFMAVLWLFPFNTIELVVSLPFDLQFDRILLPFLVGLWLLALVVGGRNAPRLRLTAIHVAVAVLGFVVSLGLVLDSHSLNQTLEFDQGVKKLSLLISYGVLFVVVASTIRLGEIPAFLKYTLGLAIAAALGTIWEHRMGYNVFYSMSDQVLPPIFKVGAAEAGMFDGAGRSLTRGPGEHPLEIVAMLSMALPIALMGMLSATRPRTRLLFALATCVLLAAALSTDRKSSLLAPLAVGAMFAYYRRAELVKIAPLAVGLVFGVQFLAPGAVGSILFQLNPENLGVGTVSDRASDYDAVRPDVWSHLLVGRGYGTYDHVSYRILDSEVLKRLIDSGILGLIALVGLLMTIIVVASRPIRMRHPQWSPPALVAAPAAVAYLLLAFLFDVGSFPHAPYILMCIAGLLAAAIGARREWSPPRPTDVQMPRREVAEPKGERLVLR
jgi:hypothetical protein